MGNEMDELLAEFRTFSRPDLAEWKEKVRRLYDKEFQTACEAQYQLGLLEEEVTALKTQLTLVTRDRDNLQDIFAPK